MEKLGLHSPDVTAQNIDKLAELFPNVVTEGVDVEDNRRARSTSTCCDRN